jgi:Coenzyme PQQ synthesis protein D (PqqD)
VSERVIRLRQDAIHFREIEGEIVAVDVARGEYVGANRSAARLWPAIVDGATIEALTERLAAAYRVPAEQLRGDVEAFVAVLDERGLLHR